MKLLFTSILFISLFRMNISFPFKSGSPTHPDDFDLLGEDPNRINTHESLAMSELPIAIRPDYGLWRAIETFKTYFDRKNKKDNQVPRSQYNFL